MLSWVVIDLNLRYAGTDGAGEGRNKAVELTVQVDFFNYLAAVGLEGTAIVVKAYSGYPGSELVGEQRRQPLAEKGVFARLPPAADYVVAFIQFLQQPRNGKSRVFGRAGIDGCRIFKPSVS